MATGVGIDVGSQFIKVVQAKVSGNTVTVTGAIKIPRLGVVADEPEAPANGAASAFPLPATLGQELKAAKIGTSGTLGLSGREMILKYLAAAPMPVETLRKFVDVEVGGKVGGKMLGDGPALTYDWRILNTPGGLKGDLILMAGACKTEYLLNAHTSAKKAGIGTEFATPSCLGLVNTYLRTQTIAEKETVVLVEIGHELLEIAIIEENNLYFARSAPGGGKKFTAGLEKILKQGPDHANEFKHERARIYPEGAQIPNKQELIFQAGLKEAADAIAGAIRASIMFCRTQAKLPKLDYNRLFISGGGARMAGLKEYLEKKVSRPVQILDISSSVDLRQLDAASAKLFESEITDMAVPLGLAIIDADKKAFHFELVPEPIVKKREFLRKTVFAIAAAVVMIAGILPPYLAASGANEKAQKRVEFFQQKENAAKQDQEAFRKQFTDNRALAKEADYYASQTRMNRVYLDLFHNVTQNLMDEAMISYMGPANETSEGALGAWNESGLMPPVLLFEVRGQFSPSKYPKTDFNDAFEDLRKKLRQLPGVVDANLRPLTRTDLTDEKKPGWELFEFIVKLQDPAELPVPGLAPAKPKDPKVATTSAGKGS